MTKRQDNIWVPVLYTTKSYYKLIDKIPYRSQCVNLTWAGQKSGIFFPDLDSNF
jgi:hypothetical protein